MQSTQQRLAEVKSYFDNGDTHVGYRRLLDAAIDTQSMSVYQDTLDFCDWYDKHPAAPELNQRVSSLLDRIGQSPDSELRNVDTPVVIAENLSKTYQKGNFSLSSLNFTVTPGKIVGLVGENGNGKTTLLRLLYGELKPDQGAVKYNLAQNVLNGSFYDTKTRLGFIPQRPNAWYGSLMDNLQFTSTHYGFKGRENFLWTEMICARMGLRAFRTYTWGRISSGYKMRFELARTLLKKPEVLLLDEPLANLDVLAQQVILEDLRFLAQSRRMPIGVILSSQQLYEVEKVSEQVIFLKEGKPRYQQLVNPGAYAGETAGATTNATASATASAAAAANTTAGHVASEGSVPGTEPLQLVFELETTAGREQLRTAFAAIGLQSISYNGGVYLLYFPGTVTPGQVIRQLGASDLPVKYFRDISTSSRRFFNA